MSPRKTSLKDIAKEVGVSIATVSYVLSERKDKRISESVAASIRKVAKEMNYRPNQVAKSLKSGKTNTIGLIVADISNPFFAQIARIVEDEAAKRGYTVIFGSSDEMAEKSWKLIEFLMNRQVEGFIIVPSACSEEHIEYMKSHNVPFVLIDRKVPAIQTNYVGINNYSAAYTGVKTLIESGSKKIAMLANNNPYEHMRERIRGYKEAIQEHGLPIKKEWIKEIRFSGKEDEVNESLAKLLSQEDRVDAIFFGTNTLGILGLKYFMREEILIPEDVSVVCFDEAEAFEFFHCPITHIKQPLADISTKALTLLIDQIEDPSQEMREIKIKAELVLRDSHQGKDSC